MNSKIRESINEVIKYGKLANTKRIYNRKINNINKNIKELKDIDEASTREYWKKLGYDINTEWHKSYATVNGIKDEKYLPEPIFYNYILPELNDSKLAMAYADKNIYSRIFNKVKQPITVIKNKGDIFYDNKDHEINKEQAIQLLKNSIKKMIIKPSLDSGGGRDMGVLTISNQNFYLNHEKITFERLHQLYSKNYIVQHVVEQHDVLKKVHPKSLNTLRITTLRHNQEIFHLSTVVRFGNTGSIVDNYTVGGVACGVKETGYLNSFAINKEGKKFTKHPYTDVLFEGLKIPNYASIIELVKEQHKLLSYFDIASWDIAINKCGDPIFIELNIRGQEINFHQFSNGPLLGENTASVIKRINDTNK